MAWFKRFPSPIVLAHGGRLHTLEDALNYIAALPEAESDTSGWRLAKEALNLAAERSGHERLARAAMLQALQSPRASKPPNVPKLHVVRKGHQP